MRRSALSSLLALALASAAASASGGSGSGGVVPDPPLPPPEPVAAPLPESLELVSLTLVTRHGDRSPLTPALSREYWLRKLPPREELYRVATSTRTRRVAGVSGVSLCALMCALSCVCSHVCALSVRSHVCALMCVLSCVCSHVCALSVRSHVCALMCVLSCVCSHVCALMCVCSLCVSALSVCSHEAQVLSALTAADRAALPLPACLPPSTIEPGVREKAHSATGDGVFGTLTQMGVRQMEALGKQLRAELVSAEVRSSLPARPRCRYRRVCTRILPDTAPIPRCWAPSRLASVPRRHRAVCTRAPRLSRARSLGGISPRP
jgi:hypothetical protein